MMHSQASPTAAEPTCPQISCSHEQSDLTISFRPPPGLEEVETESQLTSKKSATVALSLSDLCAQSELGPPGGPPPGLPVRIDKCQETGAMWLDGGLAQKEAMQPPPGLLLPSKQGIHRDVAGGARQRCDSEEDPDQEPEPEPTKLVLADMALQEVSQLKADSPMFCPLLTPSTAAMLLPPADLQRTSLRTKLSSKCNAFMPSAAAATTGSDGTQAFVPMPAVDESWQSWQTCNSLYGCQSDGISSYDTNAEYYSSGLDGTVSYDDADAKACKYYEQPEKSEYYQEQEWSYEEEEWPYEM